MGQTNNRSSKKSHHRTNIIAKNFVGEQLIIASLRNLYGLCRLSIVEKTDILRRSFRCNAYEEPLWSLNN